VNARPLAALAFAALAACGACATPPVRPELSEQDRQSILAEELGREDGVSAAPQRPPMPAPAVEPALERRITMTGVGVPLGTVLERLAAAAGLRLVVEREVDLARPVQVQWRDTPVGGALRSLLAPLAYHARVVGEELVVYAFEIRSWTVPVPAIKTTVRTEISNTTLPGGGTGGGGAPCAGGGGAAPQGATGQVAGVNLGASTCVGTESQLTSWEELEQAVRAYLSSEGTLTVNRALGILTVRERPDRLAQIDRFLGQYHAAASQQIAVQVRAIEVQLTASDQYGIDWSRVWSGVFGTTRLTTAAAFASPLTLPFSLGLTEGDRLRILIKALSTQGKVRVLNQPSIRLVNGVPAVIQVGRVQTFLAQASTTVSGAVGTTTSSLQLGSVQDGVILPITAWVVGDEILLNLAPVVSRVRQIRTITSGATTVEAPELDNRSVQTTVRLRNGETVVLGGFIGSAEADRRAGVPLLLRSVPVLGWLFGSLDQQAERTEVVLTLTPTLIESRPATPPAAAPAGAPALPPRTGGRV
jgi:type IVB pilus formation R64 PilN family outer membrane protein